jgi:hypothetical protein
MYVLLFDYEKKFYLKNGCSFFFALFWKDPHFLLVVLTFLIIIFYFELLRTTVKK